MELSNRTHKKSVPVYFQQDRFIQLMRRHAYRCVDDIALTVFQRLQALYSQDWRSYHNSSHIEASLNYFQACKSLAQYPDQIELAIWFHDCIYDLDSDNNEEKSRDWFLRQSEGYLVPAVRNQVAVLIMDTTHKAKPDTLDGQLLCDIDLTSFGLPWEDYLQDCFAVQKEFGHLDELTYIKKKICFLTQMLSMPSIYYTNYYKQYYELNAKNNLNRHLKLMSERLDRLSD